MPEVETKKQSRFPFRIVLCLSGFVVFGLVVFFIFGNLAVDKAWLDSLGNWAWLAAVLILVSDVVMPIPATLVITAMGQNFGPILGGLIATLGSFSAGVVAYGLTRLMGERVSSFLLGSDKEAAERLFLRYGSFAIVCSRWLPLLSESISCLAGLARMPFGRYCIALLCGTAPMCFAFAGLAAISENEAVPLIVSILLPVPIWLLFAWLARRI